MDMNKKYLLIGCLQQFIDENKKCIISGYQDFIQTDVFVNHVDVGAITRQSPTLVRSWFDEVFCEQPCLIIPPVDNVISKFIDDWGKSRARNHVLLIGRELAGYATEDMPCIFFDDGPFFFAENCYTLTGWQELAAKMQDPVIVDAMKRGKSITEIIGDALDDAIAKNF